MGFKERYAKTREHISRYRKHYLAALAVVIILLLVFGARFALYLNFLLGNDIVLELGADKTTTSLVRGGTDSVMFEADVRSNPFCSVVCSYAYQDISDGIMLDNGTSVIKSTSSFRKTYNVTAERLGDGLGIYRFGLDCHGIRTFLCQTQEEPTTRSVLFTVQYNITAKDRTEKQELLAKLRGEASSLQHAEAREAAIDSTIKELDEYVETDNLAKESAMLSQEISSHHDYFMQLLDLWNSQDYDTLESETGGFMSRTQDLNMTLVRLEGELNTTLSRFNSLGLALRSTGETLDNLSKVEFSDWNEAVALANAIILYNRQVLLMEIPGPLDTRASEITSLGDDVRDISQKIDDNIRTESLTKDVEADVFYDVLCNVSGECTSHPDLSSRSAQNRFDLNMSCARVDELRDYYEGIRDGMEIAAANQSYPGTAGFWKNVSRVLEGIRHDVAEEGLRNMKEGANSAIIRDILDEYRADGKAFYTSLNLTPALVVSMESFLPERCDNVRLRLDKVREFDYTPQSPAAPDLTGQPINITEPPPSCPVFGEQRRCCFNCEDNSTLYPVLLLHGHAVNRDLSAEYSLEGFNQIQKALEKDGYINAGSITLFTPDTTRDHWSLIPAPMVFRGSYYFDIFGEPQNYVAVQAKSESIDTYAIRLNDLVDTVLNKTGRSKVKIVAFSMGGLVARRYIQVFGTGKVDRLIMIGTPNKGIVGEIAALCPLIGEDLECRDMDSNSLFINKLNRGALPPIPIYNIVGTGCDMGGKQGDGAVLEENALLDLGAHNYIINGTCESPLKPLHLDLRNIDKYPEVYNILRKSLES